MTKSVSLIVAASENNVIGVAGDLPWHISSDLKRFRKLTMDHHIIMGRKTFESIGRLLPGRQTVIVTRNTDYNFAGAKIASSVQQAIELTADDPQPFVTGGAQIYRSAIDFVETLHLTRVHTVVEGDTFFPEIDWDRWKLVQSDRFHADNKNQYDYSFLVFKKTGE
ncbi:MAG: dihydrofolate reductase [Planctomycetota bacterium]